MLIYVENTQARVYSVGLCSNGMEASKAGKIMVLGFINQEGCSSGNVRVALSLALGSKITCML